MRVVIIVLSLLSFAVASEAGQKYNGMTGRYETVPDDWEVKYNGMNNTYSYQPEDAQVEYNGMENQYDWNSGHGNDRRSKKSRWNSY